MYMFNIFLHIGNIIKSFYALVNENPVKYTSQRQFHRVFTPFLHHVGAAFLFAPGTAKSALCRFDKSPLQTYNKLN